MDERDPKNPEEGNERRVPSKDAGADVEAHKRVNTATDEGSDDETADVEGHRKVLPRTKNN